jgi:EAL domain-containing protein (putative c-di-GMP-specific phosphodiesterase class I)
VPDDVARALKGSGLDPRLLEVELTESTIQHEDTAAPALRAIRALGARVAIDDFGTGFSCLSSLRHLPLDRLKIDRSFVETLPDDVNARVLTDTVISIAHRLGLGITAEGVENEQQLGYLRDQGCDTVQGWLFGRAEPVESIDRRLGLPAVAT